MIPSPAKPPHAFGVRPTDLNLPNISIPDEDAKLAASTSSAFSNPAIEPRLNLLDTAAFSPVNEKGCFEFDRVIKSGPLLKRGKLTKNYKLVHLVLRPLNVSIYADAEHTQLRHLIPLSEISVVAKRKDSKRRPSANGLFTIYTPPRNFHFDAKTETAAEAWISQIRSIARIDEYETGLATSEGEDDGDQTLGRSNSVAGTRSAPQMIPGASARNQQANAGSQDPFGVSVGSFSSISSVGAANFPGSSVSLSLPPMAADSSNATPKSGLGRSVSVAKAEVDQERVLRDGWLYLLKSKGGVKKWKPVWAVFRVKSFALYPNEQEYSPLLIIPFPSIIDAVEIDSPSKSKKRQFCMQIITEEQNWRICAQDEEDLTKWLGTFKSLISKRRAVEDASATVSTTS